MTDPPMRRLAAVLVLAVASLAGCRSSPTPHVAQPIAPGRAWASPLHRDHPLAGRIWDVRGGRFVDEAALQAAVRAARLVLLGEVHDNPDHHLLQARLVRAKAGTGGRPAVAFEMLTTDQQAAVDAALARPDVSADAVGAAVEWAKSGWPPFPMYRPIFEAALAAKLRIAAANLPRAEIRNVMMKGEEALPPRVAARIAGVGPPSEAERATLRKEMEQAHCGEFPEAHLDPMILGQRARDAQMADVLLDAGPGGAVLITGAQHARKDRGVPAYLLGEGGPAVSVGFQEVSPEASAPTDYAPDEDGTLPFDFVVFTPAAEREDPCEQLREHMKKAKAPTPTPTSTSTSTPTPALSP